MRRETTSSACVFLLPPAPRCSVDLSKCRNVVLTVIFHLDFPVLDFRHLPITDGLLHMRICFQVKNFWKGQKKDTLDSWTYVGCRFSHVFPTASQEHPRRLLATAQSEKMSYQIAHSSPMILTSNQEQGHIRVHLCAPSSYLLLCTRLFSRHVSLV